MNTYHSLAGPNVYFWKKVPTWIVGFCFGSIDFTFKDVPDVKKFDIQDKQMETRPPTQPLMELKGDATAQRGIVKNKMTTYGGLCVCVCVCQWACWLVCVGVEVLSVWVPACMFREWGAFVCALPTCEENWVLVCEHVHMLIACVFFFFCVDFCVCKI